MPVRSTTGEQAKRTLLRDTVLERLRTAILDGTFEPGERLYDDQIEQWLGVSRTPVRETINELTRAGLVEISPNRYTRVAVPREEEVVHALQTIGILLRGMVRCAVPQLTPERRAELQTQFSQIADQVRDGGTRRANTSAVELWRSIARDCGNPLLVKPSAVGERIGAGDALGAEQAVERLHLLPETEATSCC